jgi:predicted ATPase
VRALVETEVLVGTRGAHRLVQPIQGMQVPATVQAVLAARVDRVPPEDKRLLQTAAVVGTDVPVALLRAIADVAEEALHRGLAHLQAAEWHYPCPRRRPGYRAGRSRAGTGGRSLITFGDR